jgi:hypothetical protein
VELLRQAPKVFKGGQAYKVFKVFRAFRVD